MERSAMAPVRVFAPMRENERTVLSGVAMLIAAVALAAVVGACRGNSTNEAHGTPIAASEVRAAVRLTASKGTMRVTVTCTGPVGVVTPTTDPSQAVDCGAGSGLINFGNLTGPPSEDFTKHGAMGQPERVIVSGSKAWDCQALPVSPGTPTSLRTTCMVSAATDGSIEDPMFFVPGSHLSVVGSAVIDGVPVRVVNGFSDSRGIVHGTVAIGADGLIHQVSSTSPKSAGFPAVTTTWTFTDFSLTTPITAPPASVQTIPSPSLG